MSLIDLLGVDFNTYDLDQTVDSCMEIIDSGKRGYPVPVNVNILMQMRTDASVKDYVNGASIRVADGMPLVWLSRLWHKKTPLPERVTGIDLMIALIERASTDGKPVYFLGSTKEVIESLVDALSIKLPTLQIAGYSDGFFGLDQEAEKVEEIANSGAKLLCVGMGVPRQEQFIMRQWDKLGVGLVLAGGGSFDVLSGAKQRSPALWSKLGLEWLYRLAQDPKRYFMRYLETFPRFILIAMVESVRRVIR